ncbi:MAG: hypothetical protein WAO35_08035 [Terriglobia bacterium]
MLFLVLATAPAGAQDKLSNLEWFVEYGGSFLSLGHQGGTFQEQYPSASYDVTLVAPSHFSSSEWFLTGVQYRLSARDSIEASYSIIDHNYFASQTAQGGPPRFLWEQWPIVSLSYARYLGSIGGWKPFLVGGAGVAWTSSLITGQFRPILAFDFGFGANLPLANGLALRLEARDSFARLPSPFRGFSQDLAPTAGLVFSSRSSEARSTGFPQLEIFIEGGASALTGGSTPSQVSYATLGGGGGSGILSAVVRSSFSKAGRCAGGFRLLLTAKNALEFAYSQAPNRYQTQESTTEYPPLTFPAQEFARSVQDYSADYVRYLTRPGPVEPFVAAGAGLAHFHGIYADIDKFSWNFGVGADVPLQKRLALRFELKDFMSAQPNPIRGITHNLAPSVGLALRFK